MFTLNEIREKYLSFFEGKKHKILKSASLVPDDPTLMFTNAGMVPLKNYYTGLETPPSKRMASCQKCVRAGGKHNDLDNVGYTARHHTFFEMLGNFSIGDYFKKEAITWAWDFLTNQLMLPPEKLLATVYFTDEEAYQLWKDIAKLPDDRIIKIPTKDNFWEMGDTGPCGPSTEIFYDHGADIPGGKPGTPEEDGDRYIEIWNNVFTQFERMPDGSLVELKHKNIDTGMGLERIAAVLQGVHNNYDIDLFKRLIDNSKAIIGGDDIFAHRVVADHLRSTSFLICDGVLPSNEGRGYVLRRIMRRAMRHIHQLGAKEPMMYKLVPTLVDAMGKHYTELKEHEDLVMETLENEEVRFRQNLERGLGILNSEISKIRVPSVNIQTSISGNGKGGSAFELHATVDGKKVKPILDGKVAFTLYDTYGFPIDLTESILREKGIEVDTEGFEKEMEKQKKKAKEAWVGSGDVKHSKIYFDIKEKIEPTEFLGYENNTATGRILAMVKDGVEVNEVNSGDEFEFFVDRTPFYGECGGQVGDSGLAIQINSDGVIPLPFTTVEILDVKRPFNNYFLHKGRVETGSLKVGDYLNLSINVERRNKIRANHSATHLLQYALRKIFGETLVQRGSSVDEYRARFDFTLSRPISKEQIREVENIVNDLIFKNTTVTTKIMSLEEARKFGAMALFNEKYEDEVRVLFMGEKSFDDKLLDKSISNKCSIESVGEGLNRLNNSSLRDVCSVELCGGTHVFKTGEIGLFKIANEESIASGVRRIEAVTGLEAIKFMNRFQDIVHDVTDLLQIDPNNLVEKIKSVKEEYRVFKKQLENMKKSNMSSMTFTEENDGVMFAYTFLKDANPKDVKGTFIDFQNKKYNNKSILLCMTKFEGKFSIILGISRDLNDKLKANEIIKNLVEAAGGSGGGGQPWFAMGGSADNNNPEVITNVVDIVRNEIKNSLK